MSGHATYVPCHLLKVAPVPKKNTIGQLAIVFSIIKYRCVTIECAGQCAGEGDVCVMYVCELSKDN